ncbi:MAG: lyase domain protein repeat-containing protein [Chthonomonadaceae bacterium]|nr:lyase domain protein repeat-containing protein [Chthonomonadaceae bacterium]
MASINKTQQRIEELQSGDVKTRKKAARWLGHKGTYEATTYLLAALKDSNWTVRANATLALGKIGDIGAVEPLIGQLSDRTLSVRRAAIHALGALGDLRAADGLMLLHRHTQLGSDALQALIQIGAPALLYCCQQMQSESLTARNLGQDTAHQMIRQDAEALLKETLLLPEWTGQQRWLIMETVRKVQSSLSFLEIWQLTKFARLSDIPSWCERVLREPEQAALHLGTRQVLDYIMLGRASQRDYTTDGSELLRAAVGTNTRDTGETLLRASDTSDEIMQKPSLLGRLRRWLGQEG